MNAAAETVKTLFILTGLMLLVHGSLLAQQDLSELSVDELFEKARMAAFEQDDYAEARKIAYMALERAPNYHGIRIFVARLYNWEGNYDKARKELHYVLGKDAQNREALLTLADTENWSGNPKQALKWINIGVKHYSDDPEFMFKKASVEFSMGAYEQSEKTYKLILQQFPDNRKARNGLESVKLETMKYSATLSYRYDHFREIFDPWQFLELGLTRETPIGSVTGRIQYAERFSEDGVQFNIDAYPSFTEGFYAYVSGGYSDASVFPQYRFGISLYKSLPAAFEIEAGMRYLDFETSKTDIYTFSLTKYLGNYYINLRNYFIPSNTGDSNSLNFIFRRYFSDANTYFSLNGGFGSSSVEVRFAEDIAQLDSWSVSMDGQYALSDRFYIGGNAGYDSSDFPNFTRKRFSFKTSVTYRF